MGCVQRMYAHATPMSMQGCPPFVHRSSGSGRPIVVLIITLLGVQKENMAFLFFRLYLAMSTHQLNCRHLLPMERQRRTEASMAVFWSLLSTFRNTLPLSASWMALTAHLGSFNPPLTCGRSLMGPDRKFIQSATVMRGNHSDDSHSAERLP